MPLLHYFYAFLVVVLWGANFVASKFALEQFPPIFATAGVSVPRSEIEQKMAALLPVARLQVTEGK